MKINFKKGFTLIELLVVVAIIGILASVVLASLNTARAKGSDAAIKADLAGVRTTAELEYDTLGQKYGPSSGNTVNGVCTRNTTLTIFANTNIQSSLGHAKTTSGAIDGLCQLAADGTAYAIAFALKTTGTAWCIDSTGVSRDKNSDGFAYTGTVTTGVLAYGADSATASSQPIATGATVCN